MIPLLRVHPNRPPAAGRWSRKVAIDRGICGVGLGEFGRMRRVGRKDPQGLVALAWRKPAGRGRGFAAGTAIALVLSALASGCVGPNFVPPPAPDADGYLPGKLASPGGGG